MDCSKPHIIQYKKAIDNDGFNSIVESGLVCTDKDNLIFADSSDNNSDLQQTNINVCKEIHSSLKHYIQTSDELQNLYDERNSEYVSVCSRLTNELEQKLQRQKNFKKVVEDHNTTIKQKMEDLQMKNDLLTELKEQIDKKQNISDDIEGQTTLKEKDVKMFSILGIYDLKISNIVYLFILLCSAISLIGGIGYLIYKQRKF